LNNFIILVLDGIGIGELPDASRYNDTGSNTICNIAEAQGSLNLPNLQKMGLGNITPIKGITPAQYPLASFGKMAEKSKGKDSTTGHWELGGLQIDKDFDYFPDGFPDEMVNKFIRLTGCRGVLGNKAASGTEIIKELGDEHVKTGYPIIYTSADSVFQIAAHEEVIPLSRLYEICKITRSEVLESPLNVGRVIARPFITGIDGQYIRTVNRKDYSLDAPGDTILDLCYKNNIATCAIGKINDLFNHRGIKISEHSKSNREGVNKILEYSLKLKNSLLFINLVDFDVYYGHRNDVDGFVKALSEFDDQLPAILNSLDESDYIVITSDHGNDPTTASTDHSREYVPLLFYNKRRNGKNLGIRKTFADVSKTAADFFKLPNEYDARSFL